MFRLVLARHGQTPANVEKILDTVLPGPGLTDLGRLQAEALGKELVADPRGPVTALVSSPARRARETAGLVAPAVGLTAGVVEGTHEVQVGELEGLGDDDSIACSARPTTPGARATSRRACPAASRAATCWTATSPLSRDCAREHRDGTVVLVSHGAVLRLVAHALVGAIPDPRSRRPRRQLRTRPARRGRRRVVARGVAPGGPGRAGLDARRHRGLAPMWTDSVVGATTSVHLGYAQPSRCRVASSIPKWWAISWTTVTATSSRSSSSSAHIWTSASR